MDIARETELLRKRVDPANLMPLKYFSRDYWASFFDRFKMSRMDQESSTPYSRR